MQGFKATGLEADDGLASLLMRVQLRLTPSNRGSMTVVIARRRVLVGMGSTVLDGAVIGDESFIAAGSLVTPGTIIPPRSFVMGRPAKVVRPVKDTDITWINGSAAAYVAHARDFAAKCKRVG